MPKNTRDESLIAANLPPWRWTKFYLDPDNNRVITARLYLNSVLFNAMHYELRYSIQGDNVEYVITKITTSSTELAFHAAAKMARKNNLGMFFDDAGRKSTWQQENYDPASTPEPIPAPPKTGHLRPRTRTREQTILGIKKQLKRLITKRLLTADAYIQTVEWLNELNDDQLREYFTMQKEKEKELPN